MSEKDLYPVLRIFAVMFFVLVLSTGVIVLLMVPSLLILVAVLSAIVAIWRRQHWESLYSLVDDCVSGCLRILKGSSGAQADRFDREDYRKSLEDGSKERQGKPEVWSNAPKYVAKTNSNGDDYWEEDD